MQACTFMLNMAQDLLVRQWSKYQCIPIDCSDLYRMITIKTLCHTLPMRCHGFDSCHSWILTMQINTIIRLSKEHIPLDTHISEIGSQNLM